MDKQIIDLKEVKKLSADDLFKVFTTGGNGLSGMEAERRLQAYGPNQIIEKKKNPIIKFLLNFWGPIQWMIEAAAIISLVIGRLEDFAIIVTLLLINVLVKFFQENKASNAIELLKRKLSPSARVKRDGKWLEVNARELVPGDVIRIRLGDIIPADVKLIEGRYMEVDQAVLTGESLPVEKHAGDVGYSGAIVRKGEMDALVVATGMDTYFGKTARLAEKIGAPSHFQKAVVKIGDYLIMVTLLLVLLVSIVEVLRGHDVLSILEFALVLTIAGVPVALPAVLSVTMAVGAMALAKKEAIVSKLVAIEEMAGMDILCADKTGTITQNLISVAGVAPFGSHDEKNAILYAALASREEDKDPIDLAIIKKTRESKELDVATSLYAVSDFLPFDPVSKRTEARVAKGGVAFRVTKGAPQMIVALCGDNTKAWAAEHTEEFARKGYRTLGVAKSGDEGQWDFVGLISLHDPPREDSKDTIDTARSMGLDVKMITGDHVDIAKEIAREVGMGTNIQPQTAIVDTPDEKAADIVEKADGFAEVFPEHKYRIVGLLQKRGHIVGMTGDGVNDVPALQKADAGIAVAGATDAAKSAASIVLTLPGISVIIDSIKESRKIFRRMISYSIYRMGETIRLVFFVTASIIIFNFYPITALMVVLLALLNDFPIMAISYDNVLYSKKPERWNMRTLLGVSTALGLFGVLASFSLLYIGLNIFHLNHDVLQSFIYLKLSVAGHLFLFVARTRGPFWSVKPSPILLIAVILTQLTATIITVYGILLPAMGWGLALFVWGYAFIWFLTTDVLKLLIYSVLEKEKVTLM
ncbi:putative plasma-membrane proton-efflux P-type ATPase [Methanocella paludicola SANAE]|uniref:Plasma-membrane proton-efflux P-type ATPase n=1 Tax=Methanocella paludicola (strain DSM 17711 / JCM 13418 / NBRC 101707 / SANAE) TaxID=304371 RepID=D1YY14_METPS|nr:plasma-membrane proton-efflux P-type ATPase [Methanocella paludicola]BAI61336.1 putative plasma-membrane proton-efflux P-type ATPase [Methanocella paludicola SANAE]